MTALHVTYPHGGRAFLLQWWTYDDRGHIIVAHSERTIAETAQRVFAEHPDAEIRGYSEVEIVAPSERLQKLAAQQALEQSISSFFFDVTSRLSEAVEKGRALPSPFERCPKFEHVEEGAKPDEWAVARHYGCKHCQYTVRLVGMSRVDLYERFHERWQVESDPDRCQPHEDKTRVVSRARLARDDEHLWRVCANFGHHAEGLVCQEMRVDGEPTLWTCDTLGYGSLEDTAIFYYLPVRELDASALGTELRARKAEAERARAAREQKNKDEFDRRNQERIDFVIDFFSHTKA